MCKSSRKEFLLWDDFLYERGPIPDDQTNNFSIQNSPPQNNLSQNNNVSSSGSFNSTYLTYNDDDNGFSIQYPSHWFAGYHITQYGTVIGFVPHQEEAAYVDVRVTPRGDYKSIKEYGDTFKETDQHSLLAYYRNSTTELGGKLAFRAVYLITFTTSFAENLQGIEPEPAKGLYIGTMVPEKDSIYAIVYLADPLLFDKYLPVVENMADSFKIYGKGPVIQEDNSSSIVP